MYSGQAVKNMHSGPLYETSDIQYCRRILSPHNRYREHLYYFSSDEAKQKFNGYFSNYLASEKPLKVTHSKC